MLTYRRLKTLNADVMETVERYRLYLEVIPSTVELNYRVRRDLGRYLLPKIFDQNKKDISPAEIRSKTLELINTK